MTQVFPPFEPEDVKPPSRRFKLTRHRGVPIRILIPNFFTLLGLCAGLTSIRMGIEGRYDVAIAAIVLAAFLDGVDGRIARLLKATTRFGAELDSLADFVNFGVAPAIVVFTWALGGLKSLGWIVVLVFAICAALRLARFNVMLDDEERPVWKSNYFIGVPAPAGALLVMLPLYLEGIGFASIKLLTPFILAYTVAIAFLMVSNIPTFSGKLLGQHIGREYVLPVLVLVALFGAVLLTYPFITMTLGTLVYLGIIPLSYMRYKKLDAEDNTQAHDGAEAPRHAAPSDEKVSSKETE